MRKIIEDVRTVPVDNNGLKPKEVGGFDEIGSNSRQSEFL